MQNTQDDWAAVLPEGCPPNQAVPANGTFYRLIRSETPTNSDFLSQREGAPAKKFSNVSECIARSVSIWSNSQKCLDVRKLPGMKHRILVQIDLTPVDGKLMQYGDIDHYSWWRTKNFKVEAVVIFS